VLNQPSYCGRRFEHWIENQKVGGALFANLKANNGHGVSSVLKVDGCKVSVEDLLLAVESASGSKIVCYIL
jgi:hypothetical protein